MASQTIIQEMPSSNGFFKINTIRNVERVRLQDDVNVFGTIKDVITLYLSGGKPPYYLTYFATEEQRLECYRYLLGFGTEFKLSLEKYFYNENMEDEELRYQLKKKNYNLNFHIQHIYEKVFKKDFAVFAASDSFKSFSTAQQAAMLDRKSIFIPNTNGVALVWAKTLNIPREFNGVSPLQYYRVLIQINNEKFKVISSI